MAIDHSPIVSTDTSATTEHQVNQGVTSVEILTPDEVSQAEAKRNVIRREAFMTLLLNIMPNGDKLAQDFNRNYPRTLAMVQEQRALKGQFTYVSATEIAQSKFVEAAQRAGVLREQVDMIKHQIAGILDPRNRMNGDNLFELGELEVSLSSSLNETEREEILLLIKIILTNEFEASIQDGDTVVIKNAKERFIPKSQIFLPADATDEAMAAYLLFKALVPREYAFQREMGAMLHNLFGAGSAQYNGWFEVRGDERIWHAPWTADDASEVFGRDIFPMLEDVADRLGVVENPERMLLAESRLSKLLLLNASVALASHQRRAAAAQARIDAIISSSIPLSGSALFDLDIEHATATREAEHTRERIRELKRRYKVALHNHRMNPQGVDITPEELDRNKAFYAFLEDLLYLTADSFTGTFPGAN